MSTLSTDYLDTPDLKRRDWSIIGLIGLVHGTSHFFQLVLPTLYLSLANEYGYDFVKLGFLASVFFLVSCLGQASSGFVVDRIGPAPVLRFGLSCFIVSAALIGLSNGYFMLVAAAAIGGIGNSIFHPVDYSIINHRVSQKRLGHAFSTHGLTGNLGWALTPVFMAAIIYAADWRTAAFGAGALVAAVLLTTWLGRDLLAGRNQPLPTAGEAASGASAQTDLARKSVAETLAALLVQPALWGAFLFFLFTSVSLSAVQNYTIPMLGEVYGIDKIMAGSALSSYMVAAAAGMIAGGFLVGATPNTERTVAVSLFLAGGLLVVLAGGAVPPSLAMVLVALAGFCSGVSAPSRDMLIRRVTPKGATGTVYGLVYSGMDVGSSLGPVSFGLLMDAGFRQGPWVGAAVAFGIAAFLALWVAKSATRRSPLTA
ncbi:MFS transporter [Parapusillimonas granuli]|uniref:MFS transporter n=1 Tax=Parapusillimonas granuli TaxID=380911 RepID=A0A853FW09_9BURK|nr:MFS transporter [Parapusillimonas granuli]MBB5217071.1 sugar phosphate permease [Parapusillimonas granuli]MEB2400599.1 MFS transporter [Alcaligenaceae bacterium]NYT50165.1 MFS transporter [Parapusillimonas granuli]